MRKFPRVLCCTFRLNFIVDDNDETFFFAMYYVMVTTMGKIDAITQMPRQCQLSGGANLAPVAPAETNSVVIEENSEARLVLYAGRSSLMSCRPL